MTSDANEPQSIKSAKRALELLELFEKIRRPGKVSEIAEMLGYPQSSTSALMHSLKNLGYLMYDPDERTFAPSLRVALIGGWLQFGAYARTQIFDLLSSVRDRTGEATVLSTRNGVHVQYICTLDASGPLDLTFRPGTLRPITRIAPGLILLEECDEAEIGRILRRVNTGAAEGEQANLADVLAHIETVRAQGYLALMGNWQARIGTVAIKLPVRDVFDKTLVMSVSGPARRIADSEAEIVRIMREEIAHHCD